MFYLVLSTGINNFAKLPVVTENVMNISQIDSTKTLTLNRKISIVCFLGKDIKAIQGGIFNLNQKIYKPFYGFTDFQMIAIYPKEQAQEVALMKKEIGNFTNMVKWNFIPASAAEITVFYESFKTGSPLENLHTENAFLIDKEINLRGRLTDEDSFEGKLYGYNMNSVSVLNKKMKDDVKVVLAEYRLALKKNDADREI
tara:strand:- start:1392 stop:1988 length:597 start_codon:yes stop_codon:yes gene_type:complete